MWIKSFWSGEKPDDKKQSSCGEKSELSPAAKKAAEIRAAKDKKNASVQDENSTEASVEAK